MALSISDAAFIAVIVEILLYGMYTCLFLGSSYIMIFKREKTKVIIVMMVLNTIMWSVSTTHVTITIIKLRWVYLQGPEHRDTIILAINSPSGLFSLLALECVNFVIGDGIVLWRAWVLCNRSRWILWVSSILGVATFATTSTALLHTPGSVRLLSTDTPFAGARSTTAMILTLSINLWATSLIACRTWTHYRMIRSLTGSSFISQFCKQHGILSLIIESGVFYCCTWFTTVMVAVFKSNGIYIMFCMLAQLTAIYPTLIIALVSLKSTLDVAMQGSRQMYRSQQFITSLESSNCPLSMHVPQLNVDIETTTFGSCDNIASIMINSLPKEDNARSVLLDNPSSETNSTISLT